MPDGSRFDGVLVDAPCSALGTVRRHPEVRWQRQEPDLERVAARQAQLLSAASVHVRPGGTLVYAVCSAEPEEGPDVVVDFSMAHDDFDLELTWCSAPPTDGEDAHFAARWTRTDEGPGLERGTS